MPVLALAALGVVYGDIGTSPLYTMKEVFAGNHPIPLSPDNVLGILSLILWSLIIIVSIKYVVFIMRADNRGEGGIMSLIELALHDAKGNPAREKMIILVGLLGAAMFYGDGMVTPATFSAPRASTAMAATSEESIPPESPTTAREKPFFRT